MKNLFIILSYKVGVFPPTTIPKIGVGRFRILGGGGGGGGGRGGGKV